MKAQAIKLSEALPKAPMEDRIHLEQGTRLKIIWAEIMPGKGGKRITRINSDVDGDILKYYYTGNIVANKIAELLVLFGNSDGTMKQPILCQTIARSNPAGQEYLDLADPDEDV